MKGRVTEGLIDAAFRKVRKNSIGFHIWKVEVRKHQFCYLIIKNLKKRNFDVLLHLFKFNSQNNRVEALPKEKFGIFYDDCTYIIYASTIKGSIVNQYTLVSI